MGALYTNEHHFVFFLHEAYMYVEKNFRITWTIYSITTSPQVP